VAAIPRSIATPAIGPMTIAGTLSATNANPVAAGDLVSSNTR
jgi:hypothetical protein